ncbi:MAG: hypothetical protein G8345_17940 [Magnetococcales bacterium]|nr:hypothetical protein [Magnetococcales bacterium]
MNRLHDRLNPEKNTFPKDPIGLVEDYTIDNNWNSERSSEFELWSEIPSQWGGHRLWVVFHDDTEFLQFSTYLTLKIPDRLVRVVAEAITLMNERIWLGHFEIWSEEMVPVFRVVVPLRGADLTPEQVEDIMNTIIQEAERFFPAFQWVIWGGKSPAEAVAASMVETEGEA